MTRQSTNHPRTHHFLAAKGLREQPGTEQGVGIYRAPYTARSIVHMITTARIPCYAPAGAFEARLVTVDDGTAVHARYVGTPDQHDPPEDGSQHRVAS